MHGARGVVVIRIALILLVGASCRAKPDEGAAVARSPFAVADSLLDERRFAQAHPHFRSLRDSFALAADTAGWWRAQLWWAQTLMRLGHRDSSEAAISDAMALVGADSTRLAWTLWLRCGYASRVGRPDDAVRDCARARDIAAGIDAGDVLARIHFQLGTVYSRRGLYRRSVAETERALALERRHGTSRHQLAGVLNSMGIEYAAVGRLTEAAAAYEEGLARARALADTSTTGILISNLAALQAYTGRLDRAVDLMTESLTAAEAMADSSSIIYARASLGAYYLKAGNLPEARRQLERSLAIGADVPTVFRVVALVNLGLVESAEGFDERARSTLERALEPATRGGFAFERFRAYAALVRLAVARRDAATARRLLVVAKTLADSLGSPDAEVEALTLEGRVRGLDAGPGRAGAFVRGIEVLESWRGRLALGDLTLGMAEPKWHLYEAAIAALLADGDTVAAFDVAERARARTLLEIMAERHPGGGDPVTALRQRLRERFEEATGVGDPDQRRAIDAEIRALTDSLGGLEAAARARDPAAGLRFPGSAGLAAVRSALLREPGSAVLAVFWGDSAVHGWWITADAIRARRLGRADSLQSVLDFLRQTVERPGDDSLWRRAAVQAYRQVLGPFGPTPETNLYAIVDGPLARVPLEVLLPAADRPPLGATHRIVYGPSASVLAALANAAPAIGRERAVLAVGNPRGGRAARSAADNGAQRADPALDLPFAEREAKAIRALFSSDGADVLVGRSATLARWLDARPSRYRYLHFATHAVVNDRDPDQTQLMLADGFLDLSAIRRLDIRADLVTLSACETALGRQVRGEGVLGLAHAFLAAGARGTLVTLWPVVDRSTAEFMADFYGELRRGAPAAEALRVVRQRWVAGDQSHPAYWAPFVVQGAVSPMSEIPVAR